MRSWAPVGQPPVIQYSFHWAQLSAIAGITFWRFYFRFFPGAIRTAQLLEFLKALRAQIRGRLLIIWDRLNVHRSRLVREWVEAQEGAVQLEFLPAYAPELNPVEGIWNHLKNHRVGKQSIAGPDHLKHMVLSHLRRMQKLPYLVRSFFGMPETVYAANQ